MAAAFDKSVRVGIWLLVALLLGGATLTCLNTRQLNQDSHWVAHTHEVLSLTDELMLTLVDAETGQRLSHHRPRGGAESRRQRRQVHPPR